MEHIEGCFQTEKRKCPANVSLHGEPPDQHFWSGWPGAYCIKCDDEDDKDELCIGNSCKCPCHDEFYKSMEEYFEKNK